MLQYVVEEAVEAGIDEVIIVHRPGKRVHRRLLSTSPGIRRTSGRKTGMPTCWRKIRHASNLVQASFVIQEQPLGLGATPCLTAREAVGDEQFVVILPDDIVAHTPGVIAQMLQVAEQFDSGAADGKFCRHRSS